MQPALKMSVVRGTGRGPSEGPPTSHSWEGPASPHLDGDAKGMILCADKLRPWLEGRPMTRLVPTPSHREGN